MLLIIDYEFICLYVWNPILSKIDCTNICLQTKSLTKIKADILIKELINKINDLQNSKLEAAEVLPSYLCEKNRLEAWIQIAKELSIKINIATGFSQQKRQKLAKLMKLEESSDTSIMTSKDNYVNNLKKGL